MMVFHRHLRLPRLAALLLSLAVMSPVHGDAPPTREQAFARLLDDTGLVYVRPAGFQVIEPAANPVFPYEHALRHREGALEVRYAVRPLAQMVVEYQDPHSAAPEPEHMFPLIFQSLMGRLSRHGHTPHNEYSPQQAREQFNADWAAAALFDVNPEFSGDYRQGLLIAIHRQGRGDAYEVYLFDDYDPVRPLVREAMGSLKFRD